MPRSAPDGYVVATECTSFRLELTIALSDMGGPDATHHVSVGVAGVIRTVLSLTPKDSGTFHNHWGKYVVW